MQLHAYLNFDGDCRDAFTHYQKTLGGEIVTMQTHGDSPFADTVDAGWQDSILHAHLRVGDASLMGSDAPREHFAQPQGFAVSINVADPAEADRIFAALADGGRVTMPIEKVFWAERFGMCTDRFGIPWMVNCETPA